MTPESHTHAELHHTGHRWLDISVATCAIVLSITSLVVAIMHGRTMERMAEANARLVSANSWPLLQRYWSDVDGGTGVASLVVANGGVGPAKIEAFELFWKGRAMHDARELIAACCLTADASGAAPLPPLIVDSVQSMLLRPGATLRAYEVQRTSATEAVVTRLRAAQRDITMRGCYCSVFDECWVGDLRSLNPQRVARCPAPAVPFLSQ
jgi:hypothetical protein